MVACRECEHETDLYDIAGFGKILSWECSQCGTDNYLELVEDTYDA